MKFAKQPKRIQADVIEKIYWLRTEGKTYSAIANEVGVRCSQVDCTLRTINTYLDPKQCGTKKAKRKAYLRAIKNIQAEVENRKENAHNAVNKFCEAVEFPDKKSKKLERIEIEERQVEYKPELDRFEKLEQSLSVFQQSISQFIEEEVICQVGMIVEKNKELRKELQEIKEEFEPLKEEARRSNWIGVLKKKFGAEKVTGL